MTQLAAADARVAVLVDCDNISPEVLAHALRVVTQFGRIVLRRGYGSHTTLASRWQEALVRFAFTPCLQYAYAAGKNTSDIALALDALEALFDGRADTFCLVTSDSDFAYLCRKLRERGATVHIVGEAKTPDALRNASDQFFEWTAADATAGVTEADKSKPAAPAPALPKRRPKALIHAVSLLAAGAPDGKVGLGALGQYLKRTDPGFSPKLFGHAALAEMVRTYPDLVLTQENGSGYWVALRPRTDASDS
ncbi:NYN domain-containing protein [Piscinibacter koreensis]|uniref:NYN domain-containing protein n=1 Tax=Piscinibacter koreensis TaxID=2742824 RepID=A0A7Y6NNK1_9BURK|nr:NYN domain-containing protein [Schlegelella koreensis]NUZ06477.1 NYN domain-containing protein [Schlegelella koreensis]